MAGGLTHALFVYGTLLWPEVFTLVTGKPGGHQPAQLGGYRRMALLHASYPVLVPSPGARVDGALIDGLDRRTLALLDRYEGDEYQRVQVKVQVSAARYRKAWVYVPAAGLRPELTGREWLPEDFARLHLQDSLRRLRDRRPC